MAAPIEFRDFSGGLWVSGPPDAQPANTLRRARNTHALDRRSVRSRSGSQVVSSPGSARALHIFEGATFAAVGGALKRNGSTIETINSARISFVEGQPVQGIGDTHLFVSGGGKTIKVAPGGSTSKWGINPPTDGATATRNARRRKQLGSLDADGNEPGNLWSSRRNLGDFRREADIRQEGTGSHELDLLKSAVGGIGELYGIADALDLETFNDGSESSDEDYIGLWLRIDDPSVVNLVELFFATTLSVDTDGNFNKGFSATVLINELLDSPLAGGQRKDLLDRKSTFQTTVLPVSSFIASSDELRPGETDLRLAGQRFAFLPRAWHRLLIPKALFTRISGNETWDSIQAIDILFTTNKEGTTTAYLDDLALEGGPGLKGDYKYRFTFRNSVTNTRSNPNPANEELIVEDVDRHSIALANLPVSSDPQVNELEIWRTLGNGALFFRTDRIANGTATYTDEIGDFSTLDSKADAEFLEDEELPFDNVRPDDALGEAVIHLGRMWWIGDTRVGNRGRLYHSPAGRLEAVEGFLNVTNDDEPLMRLFVFGVTLYVQSKERLLQVFGTTVPFLSREAFGVPGIEDPDTLAITPRGAVWKAVDGVRVFDGASSDLLAFDAVGVLFQGEARENIVAFEGTKAVSAFDRYYISNGARTLVLDLTRSTWRELSHGVTAFFFDAATRRILASIGGSVVEIEKEGLATDGGAAIAVEIQTATHRVTSEREGLARIAFLDLNTQDQPLTLTAIVDEKEIVLPLIQTAKRTLVEIPLFRTVDRLAFRLAGAVSKQIELFGIDVDVYVPELERQSVDA